MKSGISIRTHNCCLGFLTISCLTLVLFTNKSSQFCVNAFVLVGAIDSSSSALSDTAPSHKTKVMVATSMAESSIQIDLDEDTKEFHQYAAAAVDLSSAHVSSQSVLSVVRSVRNWELNTRQKYLYRINLAPLLTDPGSEKAMDDDMILPPIALDSSVQVYLPSPSGKKVAIIRKEPKSESDGFIVDVWEGSSLIRRIEVGGKTTHGKVINDPAGFGEPSWSPDEKYLLYSAERLPATTLPFWSKRNNESKDSASETQQQQQQQQQRGGNNVLGQGQTERWGETYNNQEAILDLYILNVSTGRLGRVKNVPTSFDEEKSLESGITSQCVSSITLGQGVWHPNSSKIAFTGWSADQPKRLGMVYCKNRASKVYESEVGFLLKQLANASEKDKNNQNEENTDEVNCNPDDIYTIVSRDLFYSRSPRYIGESLVFLGSELAFVSHDACMAIYRWDQEKQSNENVIPTIETPSRSGAKVFGLGFPGIFLSQLPVKCDIDGRFLVTTSLWGSFQRAILVDIKNGDVHLIDIPQLDELGSQSLCTMSTGGDLIISETSCNRPASLWIVRKKDLVRRTTEGNGRIVTNARRVASFSPIAASSFSPVQPTTDPPFNTQVVSIDSNSIEGAASSSIQALLLLPKDSSQKVPMIVVPHGGPHGCSFAAFAPGIAFLASKYAVLLPNYRGSTGFGQASLNSLLTRIGRVDVEDVMLCTRHVIHNFSEVDSERIGICGGSHGGFLTAHCTSKYPAFFKAAAMRNPVTNIASMITSTDIPDWCLAEVLGEYDQSQYRGPTSSQILGMYEKSPVALVHQVKTPTLIALGLVDLRVPPSQGLEWFHSLRSQGVATKLLKYPHDCHSLNLVATEADHWMHIRHWFDKYLG